MADAQLEKLGNLWHVHSNRILPKIIEIEGFSTEDIRRDLDEYDTYDTSGVCLLG